ncbi:conserved hypothetical protein, variant [Coccidioides immitis H538.4]|uniref:Uncharacterized protein n=1 Tax=Coccidioides immitis H538.4 TaxID=396776 RepID=A0A0J8S3H6_COCIT|nr:conserved hypothetical protein, variant [Coccidioides immitis H538.4]
MERLPWAVTASPKRIVAQCVHLGHVPLWTGPTLHAGMIVRSATHSVFLTLCKQNSNFHDPLTCTVRYYLTLQLINSQSSTCSQAVLLEDHLPTVDLRLHNLWHFPGIIIVQLKYQILQARLLPQKSGRARSRRP